MTRRRLDLELVRRKLVASRAEAQRAIASGRVRVGGAIDPKAATLVAPDQPVHLVGPPEPYVSRAGRKLAGALDRLGIPLEDRRAVDVGASTGGFTDCLLQRGVRSVVAVDVGYGQLHQRLRDDPRVTVVERTNVRHADPGDLGAPFDIVVADLSFISLSSLAPQLSALGRHGSDWVVLVKPQFEAGREHVGRGGIVRDPAVHRRVLTGVVEAFATVGLGCQWVGVSSITGTTGNVEFVSHFRVGHGSVGPIDIDDVATRSPT